MRALTIRQPWATLLMIGVKTVEYRTWKIPLGALAIHAGARRVTPGEWVSMDDNARGPLFLAGYDDPEDLPYGLVLGTVEVVGHVEVDTPYGNVGNELARVQAWRCPVRARGKLGIWDLDKGIAAANQQQRDVVTGDEQRKLF